MSDECDREKGVWFRSGVSGLWYRQPHHGAGTVVEVRIDGVRFVPDCLDAQDEEIPSEESDG